MKYELTFHDRNGVQINEGDIVKISDGRRYTFFCRVTFLEDEKVMAPLNTFSFHSIEKVDLLPANAIRSNETRYDVWYLEEPENEIGDNLEKFNSYLMSWRDCEDRLETRCYRINRIE